jgi:hypothetical protein
MEQPWQYILIGLDLDQVIISFVIEGSISNLMVAPNAKHAVLIALSALIIQHSVILALQLLQLTLSLTILHITNAFLSA